MRLKCIKMAGFKSFVDITTVVLPSNLCAVVGPNGCGKSNIIDAVRWVMGESSAKQLRGESLTDVIFNGSSSRKAVGQASVELIFDNSQGRLGGEYASWGEISIKRKVTRDGQSNYYLNGDKCRRRDITDIFLGTGLGPRSYAIIEQGMISSIIDAKPEELRVYIEEAAGISKYKERRRDTENRIKKTKENLDRLNDIREELSNQISRLERQAKAAEKYTELKKDERKNKAKHLALRWRDLDADAQKISKTIADYEIKIERISANKIEHSSALEKHRVSHAEFVDELNIIQGQFYSVGSDVTRIEQSIQYARDRAGEIKKAIAEIEQNFTENEEHLSLDKKTKKTLEVELQKIQPMLEETRSKETSSETLLQEAEMQMKNCQLRWDNFVKNSSGPAQQAEVQQSRIDYLEQLINRQDEKIANLTSESESLVKESFENDLVDLKLRISKTDLLITEKKTSLKNSIRQINILRQSSNTLDSCLNERRTHLQSLLGKQSSFESLERSILNIDDKKETWLKANNIEKEHRLSEKIKVTPGWETAIEVVLGESLQAVYVESISYLKDSLEVSIEDELFLIERDDSEFSDIAGNQTLSLLAKVEVEDLSNYHKSILKDVLIEDDLSSAFRIRNQLKNGQSIITKDGVWLGKDWIRITSTKDITKGVLKRKQELRLLKIELKSTYKDVEKLEGKKSINEKNLRELEEQRERDIKLLTTQQNDHAELKTRISNIEIQIANIKANRERIICDLRETKNQKKLEQKKLSDTRKELNLSLVALENNLKEKDKLSSERENETINLESARISFRKYKDHAHEIAIKERAASTRLQSVIEGIQRLENQSTRLNDKKQQLFDANNKEDNPEETLQKDLSVQLDLRLKIEKKLSDSRNKVENLENLMRDIEQKKNLLETEIQNERNALEIKKISAQDFETRSQSISEQITEYGFNLTDLLVLLPDKLTLDDLEQALEKISNRIQRLGPINLAAIDEFNTETERKQYLDKQNDDLEEALSTLESAIRKIDKETRSRFKETYDLVNISFQELFPKLFGGGQSYLELTSDDLLEAGVSIMARPPGKKNTTVNLLSGGEKAMTAIALVFSIFKLNPAPFCMLDEVDAPLDDSNVLRYAKIVEEISSNVQVVYISHNKNAMEMANQLVGVTMHEAGVSRLVSVDIDQAVELAKV